MIRIIWYQELSLNVSTRGSIPEVEGMTESGELPEEEIGMVVDCILIDYRGDLESRARVARTILVWAAEHPDEWDELWARCQQRHEALV